MGTNFYFTPTEGPLVVYGKLHIGERLGGWKFFFRCYREEGGTRRVDLHPSNLALTVDVPRLVLQSSEAWIAFLHSTAGEITDEYGLQYQLDELFKTFEYHKMMIEGDQRPLTTAYAELSAPKPSYVEWLESKVLEAQSLIGMND